MAVIRKNSFITYIGTAAEMAAFTAGLAGDRFLVTDAVPAVMYIYTGAAWIVDAGYSGVLSAGTATIGAVTINGSAALAHTTATIGATTGAALAANANRKYALIVNDSDSAIYIKIGADAVLNQGVRLNANGGSYEMSAAYGNLDTRVINAISSAAAKVLLVTEGT